MAPPAPRKKISYLWNFFTEIDSVYARCNACQAKLSYRTSTTNLKKHMGLRHPEVSLNSTHLHTITNDFNEDQNKISLREPGIHKADSESDSNDPTYVYEISSQEEDSNFGEAPRKETIKIFTPEHQEPSTTSSDTVQSAMQQSSTKTFFDSIAQTVMGFPPDMAVKAKMEVMKVISDLELEAWERNRRNKH